MRCAALILCLAALAATSPSLVRRGSGDDDTDPPRDLNLECMWGKAGPGVGTCDPGFICDSDNDSGDGMCHPIVKLGGNCDTTKDFCDDSAYCRGADEKAETGVCTKKLELDKPCEGVDLGACQDKALCIPIKDGASRTCVALPRKQDETCIFSEQCDDEHFCLNTRKKGVVSTCQKRAAGGEKCASFGQCRKGFACYQTKSGGNDGVCMKADAGPGEKCSNGGPKCADKNTYCHLEDGTIAGVCKTNANFNAPCPKLSKKASSFGRVACAEGLACYSDDKESACLNKKDNPIDAKCTWSVKCVKGAYCRMEPKKSFGVCKALLGLSEPCTSASCKEGLTCDMTPNKPKVCVEYQGMRGSDCSEIRKCGQGLKCTQHPRNPTFHTCE